MKIIKYGFKVIIFLFILIFCWNRIFDVLEPNNTSLADFYNEKKNSLDVIYIGSSNVNYHFNTVLAFNEFGFTTGLLSAESQHFSNIKWLLAEARKYQQPKVYIIDLARLADNMSLFEYGARKTIDAMKFSMNRVGAVKDLRRIANLSEYDYMSFYLDYLLYHNNWKELNVDNFLPTANTWYRFYKGYQYSLMSNEINPQSEVNWHNRKRNLNPNTEQILNDLINYIKVNDLEVIFVLPKIAFHEYAIEIFNEAFRNIEQEGMRVINLNILNEYDIRYDEDFFNDSHYNVYGVIKNTMYISKYLVDNYKLIDHRNDKKYKSWHDEYEKFKNVFEEETGKKLSVLLKKGK